MTKNRISLLLLVALTGVSFFVFGFVLLFLYFGWNNTRKGEQTVSILSVFNSETNTVSHSYVRVPKRFEQQFNSFHTSQRPHQYATLSRVSSFDTEFSSYECYGNCQCEDSDFSRSVSALSKSLYFAVSAVSLTLAIKSSQQYFHDKCFESLEHSCSRDSITSSIDSCSLQARKADDIVTEDDLFIEEAQEDDTIVRESEYTQLMKHTYQDEDGKWKKKFFCDGHCLPNLKIRNYYLLKKRETLKCEDLSLSKTITLSYHDLPSLQQLRYKALRIWRQQMDMHCMAVSTCEIRLTEVADRCAFFEDFTPTDEEEMMISKGMAISKVYGPLRGPGAICIGTPRRRSELKLENVRCFEIDQHEKKTWWMSTEEKQMKF